MNRYLLSITVAAVGTCTGCGYALASQPLGGTNAAGAVAGGILASLALVAAGWIWEGDLPRECCDGCRRDLVLPPDFPTGSPKGRYLCASCAQR